MDAVIVPRMPVTFDTRVQPTDALTARWLAEATLRLRREVAWMWFQRAGVQGVVDGRLPPVADALVESLDIARHADLRQRFFADDPTARYLGERIAALRDEAIDDDGPWAAIRRRLQLDDAAQLVLALAVLARTDAASAAVFASCHGDGARTSPSLGLAQRLVDVPTDLLSIDAAHPLFRHGLLAFCDSAAGSWMQCYETTALVARACLFDDGLLPLDLQTLPSQPQKEVPAEFVAAAHVHAETPRDALFVPMLGDAGSDFRAWAAWLADHNGRVTIALRRAELPEPARLAALAAWCWLHDADLLLPTMSSPADEHARTPSWPLVPIRWLVPITEARATRMLPSASVQPILMLPATDHATRVDRLTYALGASAPALAEQIVDVARRFRLSASSIDAIARMVSARAGTITEAELYSLCRLQCRPDLGHLAQSVQPRFALKEMVLPAAQRGQLDEIVCATRALTRVHYRWGTGRAWNESGLSALFCGPPGTGKTMAAEAIAHELALPMYRIDLSQVVNKYIGETEKNLKRVFDAIEECDCVVFFDEADALFGKRTSVKDAHDRFANIEISYLLERMERLKGVAILATNRRKDLDEAFLRRLRYLVEFPLPGESERRHLWRYVFPQAVDVGAIDFDYLARTFQLAGGHIRSIAFNACLQTRDVDPPCIDMGTVLRAVKRELDKLGRPASPESFGSYRALVQSLFDEAAP